MDERLIKRREQLRQLGFISKHGCWCKNNCFEISSSSLKNLPDKNWDLLLKPFTQNLETKPKKRKTKKRNNKQDNFKPKDK